MSQLTKKFIGNDQVDGTKIHLDNNQAIRARNSANSADVNILALDASNVVQVVGPLNASGNISSSGTITGSNISGSSSGTNTGDVSLAAVGSSPSANGAILSGQVLTLQPADGTHPGLLTSASQTIGGAKTFSSTIAASNFSGSSSGTNSGDITITAVGSTPSGNAASLSGQALTIQPADGSNPGVLTAGAQTIGGAKTFSGAISASNLSNTNSGDVTIAAVGSSPNANAASIASQVLTLQPASAGFPGVVTTAAQTLAGVKTFSSAPNLSSLTASTALALDGSNNIVSSSTTATELGYVHGVTSAIQTQFGTKLNLSGGTMSGAINMGSNQINNLSNGTLSTDAANYGQLTSLASGLIWQGPINDPDLVDDSLSTPPGSSVYSLLYIIAASPTGAWTGLAGHAVWWDGAEWIDLSTGNTATSGFGTAVQVGARFLVAGASAGGPAHVGGSFAGGSLNSYIVTVTTNTPGSFAYSSTAPVSNWATSDLTAGSQHSGDSFTYVSSAPYSFVVTSANATAGATYTNNGKTFTVSSTISAGTLLLVNGTGAPSASGTLTKASGTGDATITFSSFVGSNWINFAGPGKVIAGNALGYVGNTLNVQYDNSTIQLNGSNQIFAAAASVSQSGVITTGTQSIAGAKTFTGTISASNLSGTNSGDITLTAVGAAPSANGASLSGQALTLQPFDSTHPGVVTASAGGTSNFLRADGTWAAPTGTVITSNKELFVLSSTNITNQYIDLGHVARTNSINFVVQGEGSQLEGASYDYSVSYTGGSGGNTRISFLNGLATGGASALVANDVVVAQYQY